MQQIDFFLKERHFSIQKSSQSFLEKETRAFHLNTKIDTTAFRQ